MIRVLPQLYLGLKKFEGLRVGVTLNPKLLLNLLGCIGWVSVLGGKGPTYLVTWEVRRAVSRAKKPYSKGLKTK